MYLIAGLGNPGRRYDHTRHNLGFLFLDYIGIRLNESSVPFKPRLNFVYRKTTLFETDVVLVKPVTYMNRSGIGVKDAMDFFKVRPESLIVCYDDLDLPVGRIRIRDRGSSGGQKGLQHILDVLGTDAFLRIRFGIHSEDRETQSATDYVLERIAEHEQELVESAFEDAYNAVRLLLTEQDPGRAMQQFNRKT